MKSSNTTRPRPRVIIIDPKGEYTSKLNFAAANLMAPWDRRGLVWDIAADCDSLSAIEAIVEFIVPDTREPIWAEGARMALITIMCALEDQIPGTWTWADVAGAISSTEISQYADLARKYYPEAVQLFAVPTKTTQSMHANLIASMRPIHALARAWAEAPRTKYFAFRQWLLNDSDPVRVLVLQGNDEHKSASKAYLRGLFAILKQVVGSPRFDDRDHNLWVVIDEFVQLGRLAELLPLLQTARSKGVRLVLATQDISSIRDVYARDQASSISSIVGTVLLGKTQGEAAEWASHFLGNEKIERYAPSTSYTPGSDFRGVNPTGTHVTWVHEDRPLLGQSEFSSDLGEITKPGWRSPISRKPSLEPPPAGEWQIRPSLYLRTPYHTRRFVRLIYAGGGQRVGMLDWPITVRPNQRAAHVAAAWTLPGAKRAPLATRLVIPTATTATSEPQSQPQPEQSTTMPPWTDEPDQAAARGLQNLGIRITEPTEPKHQEDED